MDTEIKTLVYRDRACGPCNKKNVCKKADTYRKLRRPAVIITAAVILTAAIAAVAVHVPDSSKAALQDSLANEPTVSNTAKQDSLEDETTVSSAAKQDSLVNETSGRTATGKLLLSSTEFADIKKGADENGDTAYTLMLMSDESTEEPSFYIPPMLGAEACDGISGNPALPEGKESVQTLAEPEEPADVPEKLEYVYNPDMCLELDDYEIEILERIVEAEATGQDIYGKMLVANVVINRVNFRKFPDTVEEVVFQKIGKSVQFSPVKDGRYYTVDITKHTKEAVKRVLSGEDYSRGALYFFERASTSEKKASWFDTKLDFLFKYGCHDFFIEKKK